MKKKKLALFIAWIILIPVIGIFIGSCFEAIVHDVTLYDALFIESWHE